MRSDNFCKNKQLFTIDNTPLKKIVAVSDVYWAALYQPVVSAVTLNLSVFVHQKKRLGNDYVQQFVRLVRRSKGGGQDDPLLVHVNTYCLSLSFSALYLARLMGQFDFFSMPLAKNSAGERHQIYPWLEIPHESDIKLRRVVRDWSVAAYALPILNSMISSIGWFWLHGSPLLMKAMFDAVYSNSTSGVFSSLLAMIDEAPLDKAANAADQHSALRQSNTQMIGTEANEEDQPSLHELNSALVGDNTDYSLDALLGKNNCAKHQAIKADVDEKTKLPLSSTDLALDELQSFLNSTSSSKETVL